MTTISTSKTKKAIWTILISAALFVLSFAAAEAQGSLTLSISPSLFDMSVSPGQEWRSSLRVINVNNYDLTVYLDVVNFIQQGEGGNGMFVPVSEGGAEGVTLAEWFSVTREAIVVPQEKSVEIPFSVLVPVDASPGGHFAAILVGTKPTSPEAGQAKVQTSQMVTSLFFTRVAGDIVESGNIREFTTKNSYTSSPEATFDLRFENKGNVHLQPQGNIQILNMWGQERGIIPINNASQFGNVLPESIRKFTFSWKGEWSISDIGRYKAIVSLAYGTEARQFVTAETIFWVIPYKLLLGIFITLVTFILLITWLVRLYVRHMLNLAGIRVSDQIDLRKTRKHKVKLSEPIKIGLADLKSRLRFAMTLSERLKVILNFVVQYWLFFLGATAIAIFVGVLIWYVSSANVDHRSFEVSYINSDSNVSLTSEEIIYNQLVAERQITEPEINSKLPEIIIINRAEIPGLGAEAKINLESIGYRVTSLSADFTSKQKRTVIIYPAGMDDAALRLSSKLNNAPISTYEGSQKESYITVFVGNDITKE